MKRRKSVGWEISDDTVFRRSFPRRFREQVAETGQSRYRFKVPISFWGSELRWYRESFVLIRTEGFFS